jgi:hypothetical protein
MFKCKVCAEKDQRIADLKAHITQLSQLVTPSNSSDEIPIRSLEADAILSGQQHVIHVDEAEVPKDETDAVIAERDRILSATYS